MYKQGDRNMKIIQYIDFKILDFIHIYLSNSVFDYIMPKITFLASYSLIWIVLTLIFLFIKKYREMGKGLTIGLIIDLFFTNLFLKPLFHRTRPFEINTAYNLIIKPPTDAYSFPSGHTSVSFMAAAVIYCYNEKWGIISYALATLIGFSRLYLYVHFPTDVLCGAILGICYGKLAYILSKNIKIIH